MQNNNLKFLIVDDDEDYRKLITEFVKSEFENVDLATDGVQAINKIGAESFDIVILDVRMPKVDGIEVLKFLKEHTPSTQVIMVSGIDEIHVAVECIKHGAFDYLLKPITGNELSLVIHKAIEYKNLLRDNYLLRKEVLRKHVEMNIIGKSEALQKVLKIAARVAPTESTILIQGASGTGKELFAHFIHKQSERSSSPFVAINCAAIPDTLMESELFGHEKGAFTDAHTTRQGLVEVANGGTIFLDEVGDISLAIQPKLLRFIQTGEFRRVGGNRVLKSNVRIISASNKNLSEEVQAKRFREDLFFRLNVITIDIPPLRDRKEDIPILVEYFLQSKFQRVRKLIHPDAMDVLMKYDWPGNVRELENVIERAAILAEGNEIKADDLSLPLKSIRSTKIGTEINTNLSLREVERMHIENVLKSVSGNKSEAAKILGISLKTLYTKLKQYQIN